MISINKIQLAHELKCEIKQYHHQLLRLKGVIKQQQSLLLYNNHSNLINRKKIFEIRRT